MRLLQIHAKEFGFKAVKPALKKYIDTLVADKEFFAANALVVFTSVEEDDTMEHVDKATQSILEHADKVNAENIIIYPFAHLTPRLAKPEKARKLLEALFDNIKKETTNTNRNLVVTKAPFGWYKEFYLHSYGHPLSELSRHFINEAEHLSSPKESKTEYGNEYIYISDETSSDGIDDLIKEYLERFGIIMNGEEITGIAWPLNITVSNIIEDIIYCYKNDYGVFDNNIISFFKKVYYINYINNNVIKLNDIILSFDKNNIKLNDLFLSKAKYIYNNNYNILIISTFLKHLKQELLEIKKGKTPVFTINIAPIQAYIAIQSKIEQTFLTKVLNDLNKLGIKRIIIDDSDKRLGAKIREAGKMWANLIIIIGKREITSQTVTIRNRKDSLQLTININDLYEYLSSTFSNEELSVCKKR